MEAVGETTINESVAQKREVRDFPHLSFFVYYKRPIG